jgi:hypothetical protein
MTQHKVGDTVHILPSVSPKYAGTYKVTKINPTTYRLTGEVHSNLKAGHDYVLAGPLPGEPEQAATPHATTVPLDTLKPGTAVRFTRGITTDKDRIYVVTGNAPRGYRLFPLGGSNRYHTNVPATMLEVVTTIDGWTAAS